jgi:Ca2+-binding EF-hand superfamily protein
MENRLQIPSEFRSLFTENQANEVAMVVNIHVKLSPNLNLQLAAQFQLSDVDQSGFIDANEFRDLLTRLSLHLTDEEANELIENIDKDGNGLIDFLELVQMVVQIKKGDFKFRALRKLLDVLDTTPISLLEREASRNLDLFIHICKYH